MMENSITPNNVDDRIGRAYIELMTKLFGSVPANPHERSVERDTYDTAMKDVQEQYGLEQGDPDFLEWVLTVVGRSPVLTQRGEIVYGTGDETNTTVGEAPSGEAK
jgi:hypothetical protein